jgi:hypothetical protein
MTTTKFGHVRRHLHVEVPIGSLPVSFTHTGSTFAGVFILIFGLAWGGLPVWGMMQHGLPDLNEPANWLFFLFPVLAVGIELFALNMLLWRKTVTIDSLFVVVDERGIFGTRHWQEQRAAYQGVLRRTRRVRTKNSSYTLYLVDLLHDDAKRTINLYTARSDRDWRAKWEAYARWLKLPALERSGTGFAERAAGDLDKPVAELIREGKVEIDYELLKAPAEGLAVDIEGDSLVVTRKDPQLALFGVLIWLTFPLVFVYVGFFLEDVPRIFGWLFGGMGLLFEGLALAGIVWDRISRERLRAGPDGITVNTLGPKGETKGRSLAAAEIESVAVARKRDNRSPSVLIAGDRRSLAFGRGLPEESLAFAANLVLAKIAKHHRPEPAETVR